MSTTLIKSPLKAFTLQQGRCIYCEFPMWLNDFEAFTNKNKITIKVIRYSNAQRSIF